MSEAELRGVQVMLDLSPALFDCMRAYFLGNVSLSESARIVGISRQNMLYKVNSALDARDKIASVIAAIGHDQEGRALLMSLCDSGQLAG